MSTGSLGSDIRPTYAPFASKKEEPAGTRKREDWSIPETDRLIILGREGKDWNDIAKELDRKPRACKNKYDLLVKGRQIAHNTYSWTAGEEQLVVALHVAGCTFEFISEQLRDRSKGACESRFLELSKPLDATTEAWTDREEEHLRSGRSTGKNWKDIAMALPGQRRTARQCMLHYLDFDESPDKKLYYPCPTPTVFSDQERDRLREGRIAGQSWQEIARSFVFPVRYPEKCRSQWYNTQWDTYEAWMKSGRLDTSRRQYVDHMAEKGNPASMDQPGDSEGESDEEEAGEEEAAKDEGAAEVDAEQAGVQDAAVEDDHDSEADAEGETDDELQLYYRGLTDSNGVHWYK